MGTGLGPMYAGQGQNDIKGGNILLTILVKDQELRKLHNNMSNLGTELKILGRDFMIAGGLLSVPFLAAAKSAAHATTVQRAFNAVFKDGAKDAQGFIDRLSKATGRFNVELQESFMSMQALFKGLNFGDQASKFAMQAQSLMTDLAAFRGLSDQDVMQRFVSTISGSVEAMDQLGIDVHEHAIQQELLAMGIQKSVQEASEQEKVMARLNVIFKAMTAQGAIGAAQRALNEYDGQITQLRTSIMELRDAIGKALVPQLLGIMKPLSSVISGFGSFAEKAPALVQAMASITVTATAMGAALWAAGGALRAWQFVGAIIPHFKGMAGALKLLGLAAGVSGLTMLGQDAQQAAQSTESLAEAEERLARHRRGRDALPPDRRAQYDDLAKRRAELLALAAVEERLAGGNGAVANWVNNNMPLFADPEGHAQQAAQMKATATALFQQMQQMAGDQFRQMGEDMGLTLEEEISQGIHNGMLKGIQGTYSMLSSRMFASPFDQPTQQIGESMAGLSQRERVARIRAMREEREAQQDAIRGGRRVDRTAMREGEEIEEITTELASIEQRITNPNMSQDEQERLQRVRNRMEQRRSALIARQQQREQGATSLSPSSIGEGVDSGIDPRKKPANMSWEEWAATHYAPDAGGAYSQYQEVRPGPNGEPGVWDMQYGPHNVPGVSPTQGGVFRPEDRGPIYIGPDGEPMAGPLQGATGFPVSPSLEDQPGLGAFGGGRPADPWAAEPRYRSDAEMKAEAEKEIKALEMLRDSIMELISTLNNPDRAESLRY